MKYSWLALLAACGGHAPPAWSVPAGWKTEVIRFPLDFAPSLVHIGVEQLRFPPGFLDEHSPEHWSYTFAWRLEDHADLAPFALADELTTYFRGLLTSVDGTKHRFDPAQISVRYDGTQIYARIFDAFGSAAPVVLEGTAQRTSCGDGALWTFVLAPAGSPVRPQLDALAGAATCRNTLAPSQPAASSSGSAH
jgi:hypothetical protein